jgi:hypothetical protein
MWLLTNKMSQVNIKHQGWHLGGIIVSPKKLRPPTDTDTACNVDFDTHDWSKFSPVPTFNCATKRQVLVFQGSGFILTPPTHIRGLHPSAGPTRHTIANRRSGH